MKPENPYKKGSFLWSLMEGDWEDLAAKQIAEVLDVPPQKVYSGLSKILQDTGYDVPRVAAKRKERLKYGVQKH